MSYKEQQEKEIFEKSYNKVVKSTTRISCLVFIVMGLIFFILGISLFLFGNSKDAFEVGITFSCLGLFFLFLGLIIYLSSKVNPNYDKFKKRMEKSTSYSNYDNLIRIEMLEEKVRLLEERIEYLEGRR